jgi:hypothetical protein
MTNLDTLVLGHTTGNDAFGPALSRHIRGQADLSVRSLGDSPFMARHRETLNDLADLIDSLSLQDQRLYALWQVQTGLGGSSDEFTPSSRQTDFLARLGAGTSAPTAAEALSELISAGVFDAFESVRGQVKAADERAQHTVKEKLGEADERRKKVEEKLADTEGALAEAVAERDDLRAQRGQLRAMIGEDGKPKSKPAKKAVAA